MPSVLTYADSLETLRGVRTELLERPRGSDTWCNRLRQGKQARRCDLKQSNETRGFLVARHWDGAAFRESPVRVSRPYRHGSLRPPSPSRSHQKSQLDLRPPWVSRGALRWLWVILPSSEGSGPLWGSSHLP